jgi:HEAT repeat protein
MPPKASGVFCNPTNPTNPINMTEKNSPMVTQNPKAVSPSPEKFPSAAPVWRVGMVLLVCVALFAGCGGTGDPQLDEALGKLESTSDTERLAGLTTLSEMGDKPRLHADKVAAVLKDTSPKVRTLAALLLGNWGWEHSSPETVKKLGAMASGDKDADARSTALLALSKVGANDEFAKVVKGILAGGDADLKSETLMIMGESASKESVTAVKSELEAVAGGSDKSLAAEAKIALEMTK